MAPAEPAYRNCPRCNFADGAGDATCSRCGQELDGELSVLATRGGAPAAPRVVPTAAERDDAVERRNRRQLKSDLAIGGGLFLALALFAGSGGVLGVIASTAIGMGAGAVLNRAIGGALVGAAAYGIGAMMAMGVDGALGGGGALAAAFIPNVSRLALLVCLGMLLGRERRDARLEGLA